MQTRSPERNRLGLALRLAGTALALFWVFTRIRPQDALVPLAAAPLWVLAVPPVLMMLNTLLQSLRLHLLLTTAGTPLGLGATFAIVCRAAFMGLVLPTGGQEVAKLGLISHGTGRLDAAITAVIGARLLQLPTWMLFLGWGLTSGGLAGDPSLTVVAVVFFCVASAALGVTVWSSRGPQRRLPEWIPVRLTERIDRLSTVLRQVSRSHRTVLLVTLLSVPIALVNYTVVALVLVGFGATMPFGEVVSVVPPLDALIWMPVSVSGIGVRETLFVHVLGPRGVPAATAVAIGLTRWTGELARAAIGGMLFVLSGLSGADTRPRENEP